VSFEQLEQIDDDNLTHLMLGDFGWDSNDCFTTLRRPISTNDVSGNGPIEPLWQQCLSDSEAHFHATDDPEALLLDALFGSGAPVHDTAKSLTPANGGVLAMHSSTQQPSATTQQLLPQSAIAANRSGQRTPSNCNRRAPLADAYELLCLPWTPTKGVDASETDSAIGSPEDNGGKAVCFAPGVDCRQ
jgi:hypothetical protein